MNNPPPPKGPGPASRPPPGPPSRPPPGPPSRPPPGPASRPPPGPASRPPPGPASRPPPGQASRPPPGSASRPPPGPALPPPPGEQKLGSKRARIERQKERATSLNKSPDWFGAPRAEPPELTPEDKFTSATSLSDPQKEQEQVPQPSSTFTGFGELRVRDMLVILGLWFIRLFIPWIKAWHEFSLHLLVDPSHWAEKENFFTFHETMAFVGQCLICLGIALLVDFINFKYPTYLIVLSLYIFAPIAGVAVAAVLVARGYDRQYYHDWWHVTIVMMTWAMTIPFIMFPVQFSCIFNQEKNMSRLAHYNWTAIFVLIEASNAFTSHWIIPPNCPTRYFTLFAVWCAIGVLQVVLIIEVLSLMRWAKPQIKRLNRTFCKKKEKKVEADASAIKTGPGENDVTKSGQAESPKPENEPPMDLKVRKLVLFLLMLAPVLFTSFVFEILTRSRPDEDWDKHDSVTGTGMLIGGQGMGILVVASVLFVVRKWMKGLHSLRVFSPDVLALGLPLLINTLALTVILGRFLSLRGLDENEVIFGPIPTNEVSVIEFYNVEFRNRTICVHSEHFGALKVPPRRRASSVLRDPGGALITFNVTLDPRTTPPVPTFGNFTYQKGVWVTYIVTLPETQLGTSDIEAFYGQLLLIRVNDTEEIRPKKEPLIVFINTYVVFISGWYYNVTFSGQTETIQQQYKGAAMQKSYPQGDLTITYWTEWTALVEANPPVTIKLPVEEYSVYTVLLCLSNTMKDPSNLSEPVPRMLQTHKTMEIAGPNSNRLPAKEELEKDRVVVFGMTLAGMAKAGVYVGYIYLFWLDYPPIGFDTTFLAVFWVLTTVPVELARSKVIDVGVSEVSALLALQVLFTGLHFGAAIFLYTSKFNFRSRPD